MARSCNRAFYSFSMSQAEALWESKSQIAGLACQDTRYKGPVYQTARLNNNNNQLTHKFHIRERSPSRATGVPLGDTSVMGRTRGRNPNEVLRVLGYRRLV